MERLFTETFFDRKRERGRPHIARDARNRPKLAKWVPCNRSRGGNGRPAGSGGKEAIQKKPIPTPAMNLSSSTPNRLGRDIPTIGLVF